MSKPFIQEFKTHKTKMASVFLITSVILFSSAIFLGCATESALTKNQWISYKEIWLDRNLRNFNMQEEIVNQLRGEMGLREMGFYNLPSRYFRLGYIGHDIAYDTSTFTSSTSGLRTIRDVYGTHYGQIVIEKDNYISDYMYEMLFAFALVQLTRYDASKVNIVLQDGYFDFNVKTPAGQGFTCRIPSSLATKYIDYVESNEFSEDSAAALADEIVSAMEI